MLDIIQKIPTNKLTLEELELLASFELNKKNNYFHFDQDNALEKINIRVNLFNQVYGEIINFCQNKFLQEVEVIINLLWNLWLPFAIQINDKIYNQRKDIFIQGILGSQGTGKSTLTSVLKIILENLDYSSICISLDDFYKTYEERKELQKKEPRLIWRGPPGTHDIDLGLKLFEDLHNINKKEIVIPRFDKSAYNGIGDRGKFETIKRPDIVLFEGWFVGVKPIDESLFNNPPKPIISEKDKQFAKENNKRLLDYLPWWKNLDSLIVLYPQDYHLSLQWRKEAEHKMIASGKTGMSDLQIEEFVYYFWRSLHPELFIKPLTENNDLVDLVIKINQNHLPENLYTKE